MRKQAFLLVFILTTAILTSCNSTLTKQELIDYVNDPANGLSKSDQFNRVDVAVKYRPTDLIVGQFLRGNKEPNVEEIAKLKEQYKAYLYFNLFLSAGNQEVLNAFLRDRQTYGQMVNQFAFGMKDKLFLTNAEHDTLYMVDCIFPRTYGLAKNLSILCVFEKNKAFQSDWLKFHIKDLGLYTGDINFRFKPEDIKNTPALNFN